jgi:hypothetical protein
VLLGGSLATTIRPAWTRWAALVAQAFALVGSLIGLSLVIRGVGPSTVPDLVFHVGIVLVLAGGLVVAARR